MSHIICVILFTELAAKCCREAGVWYYRILESHASEERNRLCISDISVSVPPPCGKHWNCCIQLLHDSFSGHWINNHTMSDTQFIIPYLCLSRALFYINNNLNLHFEVSKHMHLSQVLFENDLVQRCLVACGLEISTSTNRLSFDFPLLLHILDLASYHFWRVCVLSLLAMQVCVNHFVSLISQSTACLFMSILSEVFRDSQHEERRRIKQTLVRIIL